MSKHIGNQGMASPASPLVKHITALIRETGPLTFARFMELALYDDKHGYYTTGGGRSPSATSPIGRAGGDFFTAPSLSPILGKCLVRQLVRLTNDWGIPRFFISWKWVRETGRCSGICCRNAGSNRPRSYPVWRAFWSNAVQFFAGGNRKPWLPGRSRE